MPLIAIYKGERIDAWNVSSNIWEILRSCESRKHLTMPGCGAPALAKVSRLGFRYFSHWPKSTCTFEHDGESNQHLALKKAVSLIVDEHPGWTSVIEYPNQDRTVIADVFARHSSGRSIAFEVQLSNQHPDEYVRRSQAYLSAGVLPVWVTPNMPQMPVQLPHIETSWRKTSEIPGDIRAIGRTLGRLSCRTLEQDIAVFLNPRFSWEEWSVQSKYDARMAELKLIEDEVSRKSAERARREPHPPAAGSPIFDAAFNIWVTELSCVECKLPAVVWHSSTGNTGNVPTQVSRQRLENFTEVQNLVNQWGHDARPDGKKALLELRQTDIKEYMAFCCPHCLSIFPQDYLGAFPIKNWLQISFRKSRAEVDEQQSRVCAGVRAVNREARAPHTGA